MLRTLILICRAGLDPSACTPATAIDVVTLPPERAAICAPVAWQSTVAATAIRPEPGKSYVKTVCARVREAAR